MAEIKRVTLHPLKADGTVDTDINLYPKTLIDGVVDRNGEEVEVALKSDIPSDYVTLDTEQHITGEKVFDWDKIIIGTKYDGSASGYNLQFSNVRGQLQLEFNEFEGSIGGSERYFFPTNSGEIALTSDIPNDYVKDLGSFDPATKLTEITNNVAPRRAFTFDYDDDKQYYGFYYEDPNYVGEYIFFLQTDTEYIYLNNVQDDLDVGFLFEYGFHKKYLTQTDQANKIYGTDNSGNQKLFNEGDYAKNIGPLPKYSLPLTTDMVDFILTNNLNDYKPFVFSIMNYGGYLGTFRYNKTSGGFVTEDLDFCIIDLENFARYEGTKYGSGTSINPLTVKLSEIINNTYKKVSEIQSNKVTSISSNSTDTQYPSAKCVYDELVNVREVAEGKCQSYVISYATSEITQPTFVARKYKRVDGTRIDTWEDFVNYITNQHVEEYYYCANADFNTDANYPQLDDQNQAGYIITIDNIIVRLWYPDYAGYDGDLKLGDNIYVDELDVPDRWCSVIAGHTSPTEIPVFSKLETGSVGTKLYKHTLILSGYDDSQDPVEETFIMINNSSNSKTGTYYSMDNAFNIFESAISLYYLSEGDRTNVEIWISDDNELKYLYHEEGIDVAGFFRIILAYPLTVTDTVTPL